VRAAAVVFCLAVFAAPAAAKVMPLTALPTDKLVALTPVLRHADVALVESHPDGTMKQVTLILFVRARPETVHEVIAHPADYKSFVRNVSKSTWEPRGESLGVTSWRLDLPVSSFTQVNYVKLESGPTGAVSITSADEREDATWRWEMHEAPGGIGTVLVQYGYTDVKHSNALVRSFLKKMPVTEHGLALAAQLLLASNMRREAERRTVPTSLPPLPRDEGGGPGFGFLLERGQVAVMRSTPDGRLADFSLLDRIYAPLARVRDVIAAPGDWARFVPGVDESRERQRLAGAITYALEFAVPGASWSSTWQMRVGDTSVDGAAVDGDLRGARYRWDLTPRGASETLAVFRVAQQLGQSSTVFRTLIHHDPSLEHGLNIAFSLVYLRAFRGKAEGWPGVGK
jgi:hypothetical protein